MFGSNRSSNRLDRRRKQRRQGLQGMGRRNTGGFASELSNLRLAPRGENRRKDKSRRAAQPSMARGRWEEDRTGPPVMMRGSFEGLPLPTRKRPAKTRRRYDFALSVPGAEMRLPALPQVRIGWRIVSGILAAVLLAVLYQLWNSPGYRVAEAQVSGLQRITSAEVNAALGIEDEPIFTLNASELERKLQASFPEFSKVDVDVALRNKVAVTVEERLPILTWRQGEHTVLIDANGFAFPQRDSAPDSPPLTVQATGELPLIEPDLAAVTNGLGDTAGTTEDAAGAQTPFMTVDMISAVLSMSSQAPAGAVLVYDAQHGLGWKATQGWDVYFGELKDMGMKLSVYKALLGRLQQDAVQPVMISVEHLHAPYYRLEQ